MTWTFPGVAPLLFVVLACGTLAPVYAQREQGDEKGKQEREQGKQARQPEPGKPREQPRQRTQQAPQRQVQQQQPAPQQQAQRLPLRSQEQARTWQQRKGWAQKGGWQGRNSWQQDRAQHWANEHRTWGERGGYGGTYIPQDRFGLYFGPSHSFRIQILPTLFLGYPRFDYGGYSFLMVDPWPEYWQEDWYRTDDLYVTYDDGYYLYNRTHPGAALAITVIQ